MNVDEKFKNLKDICNIIYESSIQTQENLDILSKSHHQLNDLKFWFSILNDRPEYIILETAIKELEISMITLNFGFYSKSYAGLRFFLERSLVAILFSSQEIELKLWEKGERDTYWSEIIDENNGIFSSKFSRAFFPELKDEIKHYKKLTEKVYRECSEYVHGNNSAIQSVPCNLSYSLQSFNSWHRKFNAITRIILFTLNLRYLKHLPYDKLKDLEDINSDNFNSIKAIQELY